MIGLLTKNLAVKDCEVLKTIYHEIKTHQRPYGIF